MSIEGHSLCVTPFAHICAWNGQMNETKWIIRRGEHTLPTNINTSPAIGYMFCHCYQRKMNSLNDCCWMSLHICLLCCELIEIKSILISRYACTVRFWQWSRTYINTSHCVCARSSNLFVFGVNFQISIEESKKTWTSTTFCAFGTCVK